VSSHFYVRRGGQLWQFVSCDQRAWHAGTSHWRGRDNCNDFSVGIELEGLEGDEFEPAQYEAVASLCAALAQHYPVQAVAGHEHVAPGRKQDRPGTRLGTVAPQPGVGRERLSLSACVCAVQLCCCRVALSPPVTCGCAWNAAQRLLARK